MIITFNKQTADECKKFFNMISAYKVFAEMSDKLGEEIQLPVSALDFILNELATRIVNGKYYKSTFECDTYACHRIAQYMLGTGTFEIAGQELKIIDENLDISDRFSIDIVELWKDICKTPIEI